MFFLDSRFADSGVETLDVVERETGMLKKFSLKDANVKLKQRLAVPQNNRNEIDDCLIKLKGVVTKIPSLIIVLLLLSFESDWVATTNSILSRLSG